MKKLIPILLSLAAMADDRPYLVRDLPGLTLNSSMAYTRTFWTTIGNTTWFVADVDSNTTEVFKTDGTTAGTVRVTYGTGRPDPESSGPFLGTTHGKLVYGGYDASGGGLFALDAADGGPVLLVRVKPGYLTNGVLHGDTLYFSAQRTDSFEQELWRTDGTPDGTEMIDLRPGEMGSFEPARDRSLFRLGDSMFFYGATPEGTGLHRTDGTAANTSLLLPLSVTSLYNDTSNAFTFGDHLLFYLRGENERKDALWSTDGTVAGTKAIVEVAGFEPLGILGGKLLFEDHREAIWSTDGTAAGTVKTDILANEFLATLYGGGVVGNKLFFFAGFDIETLYVTQGTEATTRAIMEVEHSSFHWLGEGFGIGDKFYFRHDDGIHGMELWMTDGTTAQMLSDIDPSYRRGIDGGALAELRPDGTAIFAAIGFDTGREPWITDGTAAGTRLLANLAAEEPTHGSSPRTLRASGERVFFTATLTGGQAVGVSDGTSAGTSATLVDFDWTIGPAAAAGNRYFFSTSVADPFGLYVTDGTLGGTTGIFQRTSTPFPLRDGVVFSGEEASIWFSDGTLAGTRMIHDFHSSYSWPDIFPTGDVAWLSFQTHLWKTDGTVAGTVEIVPPEPVRGDLHSLIRSGASFFFLESSSFESAPRLWRSDSTSAGTHVVKVFASPQTGPSIVGATDHMAYLTFNGKLHRSDGTEAGTIALPASPPCSPPAVLGDTLIFTSLASGGVLTLWRSDGTVEGTTKLATMTDRSSFVFCDQLAAHGNVVYFRGWDATHGWEPWVTDGTIAGTKILADLYPGKTSSSPRELTVAGDRVFFTADSPNIGRELWAIGPQPSTRRRAVGAR